MKTLNLLNILGRIALGLTVLGPGSAWANPVEELMLRFNRPVQKPCFDAVWSSLEHIGTRMNREVSMIFKEHQDGHCEIEVLGSGESDHVYTAPERLREINRDPQWVHLDRVHNHILDDAPYFIDGGIYKGEIMFVSPEEVQRRALSSELYDFLLAETRAENLPGFNVDAPSMRDLMMLLERTKKHEQNDGGALTQKSIHRVISSAGVWTYAVSDPTKVDEVRERLRQYRSYAMMHLAIHLPGVKPHLRKKAERLYSQVMQDQEVAQTIHAWNHLALVMNAPFTEESLKIYRRYGGRGYIHIEFLKKIAAARKFSVLLSRLGFDVRFESFSKLEALLEPLPVRD